MFHFWTSYTWHCWSVGSWSCCTRS
jgi:hypothetical protein